ncbi:hypothetical protein B0H10DRAFT_1241922 [Mycena sp. CBHHK59/15]|nr:hypothetical protein B0H10DRAFT_1241922 [Mycena sp. CBHHK59/15]
MNPRPQPSSHPGDKTEDGGSGTLFPVHTTSRNRSNRCKSPMFLSASSTILHLMLVVLHLVLMATYTRRLEHRLVFSLAHQKIVSFLATVVATIFATIYCAVLVLVTQTLTMQKSLWSDQTLTATHDNIAAWSGIASAFLGLWNQKAVPASTIGVASAFLYLAGISALQITTPALFSLETFNSSRSTPIETQGSALLNLTGYLDDQVNPWFDVQTYAGGSLYSLPSAFSGNTNIGLHEGTLYDVPVGNAGIGNLSVLATGFNFTCGYFKTVQLEVQTIMKFFRANVDGGAEFYNVDNTALGRLILSAQGVTDAGSPPTDNDAYDIIFFTNLTIVDSNGDAGIKVALDFKTSAQLLRCSLSLVEQTALVDTQSWKVVSLEPNIVKQSSAWVQAPSYPQTPAGQNTSSPLPMSSSSISLADLWQTWYILAPRAPSTISFPVSLPLPDLYLNHLLRLPISSGFFDDPSTSDNITLHDLENALSTLVASIIWTLTYVPPLPGYQQSMSTSSLNASLQTVRNLTSLVGLGRQGQGVLTDAVAQVRLDLSIIAVSVGLAASAALALLSLRSLTFRANQCASIIEIGFLQAIWLYRSHPKLEMLIQQVPHPTENNLRRAGMVRTRLVDQSLREEK